MVLSRGALPLGMFNTVPYAIFLSCPLSHHYANLTSHSVSFRKLKLEQMLSLAAHVSLFLWIHCNDPDADAFRVYHSLVYSFFCGSLAHFLLTIQQHYLPCINRLCRGTWLLLVI